LRRLLRHPRRAAVRAAVPRVGAGPGAGRRGAAGPGPGQRTRPQPGRGPGTHARPLRTAARLCRGLRPALPAPVRPARPGPDGAGNRADPASAYLAPAPAAPGRGQCGGRRAPAGLCAGIGGAAAAAGGRGLEGPAAAAAGAGGDGDGFADRADQPRHAAVGGLRRGRAAPAAGPGRRRPPARAGAGGGVAAAVQGLAEGPGRTRLPRAAAQRHADVAVVRPVRSGDAAALRRACRRRPVAFAAPGRQGPGPHPAGARLHAEADRPVPGFAGPPGPGRQLPGRAGRQPLLHQLQRSRAMIEVRDLHKAFGKVKAVDGVSFRAEDGRITGLLGPNGAGKTTTLRMLYTLMRPDRGQVLVDGIDANAEPEKVRRRLGVLPDARGLYKRLSSRESIRYFGRLQGLGDAGIDRRTAMRAEALDMADIIDRRTEGFSQGQRVKTAIARALVHDPRNVLLDEPTNGLDVMATRAMRRFLHRLRDEGRCVLFSSHIMQEVAA